MKKVFLQLKTWVLSFFKGKKVLRTVTTKIVDTIQELNTPFRAIPKHNNRKRTSGRYIQAINMGISTRLVYHNYKLSL